MLNDNNKQQKTEEESEQRKLQFKKWLFQKMQEEQVSKHFHALYIVETYLTKQRYAASNGLYDI